MKNTEALEGDHARGTMGTPEQTRRREDSGPFVCGGLLTQRGSLTGDCFRTIVCVELARVGTFGGCATMSKLATASLTVKSCGENV